MNPTQKRFMSAAESLQQDYMTERARLRKQLINPANFKTIQEYCEAVRRFKELGTLLNKLYIQKHGL